MKKQLQLCVSALTLAAPLLVGAQTPQKNSPRTPASSGALNYQSAFADYKPFRDIKQGDWKALNDAVAKPSAASDGKGVGMSMPSRMPGTDGVPASMPSASGGHQMHGGKP